MDENILYPIGTILILAAAAGAVMWYSARRKQARMECAREIAARLGLSFDSGITDQAAGGQAARLAQFLLRFRPLWSVSGDLDGVHVRLHEETRSTGKSTRVYFVFEAWYPSPLHCRFRAAREGFFTKVGKGLFGLQDVEIGDAAFDGTVRITGDDPDQVRNRFRSAETRNALVELLERYPSAAAENNRAVYELQVKRPRIEPSVQAFRALAKFARTVTLRTAGKS